MHTIWATIGGYILVVIGLSAITHLWIRHHLKAKIKKKRHKNPNE